MPGRHAAWQLRRAGCRLALLVTSRLALRVTSRLALRRAVGACSSVLHTPPHPVERPPTLSCAALLWRYSTWQYTTASSFTGCAC